MNEEIFEETQRIFLGKVRKTKRKLRKGETQNKNEEECVENFYNVIEIPKLKQHIEGECVHL